MRIDISAFAILALIAPGGAAAQSNACPVSQAEAAETAAGNIKGWGQVAAYAKAYSACDDGSIAEDTSETVARLLVDRWGEVSDLSARIKADPGLENFTLRHINATLDSGDLQKIQSQALQDCPVDAARLCRRIASAASEALR